MTPTQGRRQAPARGGARVLGALGAERKQQDRFGSIPIEMGIFGWDPQAGDVHVHGDGVGGSV
jgi:hypothetical protein